MTNIVPYAFKGELMSGNHNFSAGGDTYFLALYTSNPYSAASSTVYVTTNEVLSSCLLYTSPSPRDRQKSRMPSSA